MATPNFKRVVVADAATPLGIYCVEALLASPICTDAQIVAETPSGGVGGKAATPTDPACAALLKELAKEHSGQLTIGNAKGRGRSLPDDVVVYGASVTFDMSHLAVAERDKGVRYIVVTAEPSALVAEKAVKAQLAKSRVTVVRTAFLAPPTRRVHNARRFLLPPQAAPLEHLCLGVALGVTRLLPVAASHPADFVPVDVALHVGLTAQELLKRGLLPPSVHAPNHLYINLLPSQDTALVWGMVAEYVLDYYGRFGDAIAAAMPPALFNKDASLVFSAQFKDVWNYGIALTTPLELYRVSRSKSMKAHLRRFPHSTAAETVQASMSQVDDALDAVVRFSLARRAEVDADSYQMVLRKISSVRPLNDLVLLCGLDCVEWEMYVKDVAVGVLRYIAETLMSHHEPMSLPSPLPRYANDIVFTPGEGRAPADSYPIRRTLNHLHFALRGGQQPNGAWVRLSPGGTHRNFVAILAQPQVQMLISQLAREQNLSKQVIEDRALAILRGVGDTQNHTSLRSMAYPMRKIMETLFERVNVNPEAYGRLFRLFRLPRTAIIVMPSHRSYFDFLTVSYVLLAMGFQPPHICSGEDFLGLGPISKGLRGSGAFFMRRSFKADKLYGAVFKEYVRHLVRGAQPIEFFIEGTRSRTQKTMGPKLGILKMITDAYFEPQEEINDVMILPISLSYERILEGNVYANELLGVPKPKETPMNLLRSATVLKEGYGMFNLNFREPISLAEYTARFAEKAAAAAAAEAKGMAPKATAAAATGPRDPLATLAASPTHAATHGPLAAKSFAHIATVAADARQEARRKASAAAQAPPARPGSASGASYTPIALLQSLAWDITRELQEGIVVTPTALVCAAALHVVDRAELRERGLPQASLASAIEWVRASVLSLGGKMNSRFAADDGPTILGYSMPHLNGHLTVSTLSRVFINDAVSTTMLFSMYCNQLIHLFADTAVVCAAAFAGASVAPPSEAASAIAANGAAPSSGVSAVGDDASSGGGGGGFAAPARQVVIAMPALRAEAEFLADLLRIELPDFLPPHNAPSAVWFPRALAALDHRRCILGGGGAEGNVTLRLHQFCTFAASLLYPLIEAYFVTAVGALALLLPATESAAAAAVATPGALPAVAVAAVAELTDQTFGDAVHRATLAMCRTKQLYSFQCCNRETLKNAAQRFHESGLLATVRRGGSAPALAIGPRFAARGGAELRVFIGRVNALRCRPADEAGVAKAAEGCRAAFAEMVATKMQQAKL